MSIMSKNIYVNGCLFLQRQIIYLMFLILFVSATSTAQNKISVDINKYYRVISFGEKIDFGNMDSSVVWIIKNSKNNINTTVHGDEINNYLFQEAGDYEINFHEDKKHDEECSHRMFAEKFLVKVEPFKLSFDFSKIVFSEKIEKGKIYSDLIITVPAKINTKDGLITKMPAPGMSVTGIGVALTAVPFENEILLNNKTQLLKYKISGIVNKETYLMFDFYDFNNQVQVYNLPQLIK